jgi:hypothetical protein
MQILFIDESGTPPAPAKVQNDPWFVLGGVVIPDDFWHKAKTDLEIIKKRHSVIGEIKWRFFAPQKPEAKPHSLSHLSAADKEKLRSDLYAILRKYKSIKTIAVVTDTAHAYRQSHINTPDDLYWYTYKQITERFQYYLQDISRISGQKINGIIVCDHRAPKDDQRLQELHSKLLLGHHNAHSSYSHLIEGVFIAPSHFSVGIQFADLIAGAVLRKFKGDDRFYQQMHDTLRKSEHGKVEGYGLVQFPKKGG